MSLEQLTAEELSELRGDLARKLWQADAEIARRGGGEPIVDAMLRAAGFSEAPGAH